MMQHFHVQSASEQVEHAHHAEEDLIGIRERNV